MPTERLPDSRASVWRVVRGIKEAGKRDLGGKKQKHCKMGFWADRPAAVEADV